MSDENTGTFQYMRILLAGMSNMLSSIITAALAQAPDLVVAGQIGDDEDLTAQISLTKADAVITQSSTPEAIERFVPLLRRFPESRWSQSTAPRTAALSTRFVPIPLGCRNFRPRYCKPCCAHRLLLSVACDGE